MNAKVTELRTVFSKWGISSRNLRTKEDYLRKLKKECESQIKKLEDKETIRIYKMAYKTGDDEIIALAEAMRHQALGIKPNQEKLGYRLAGISQKYRRSLDRVFCGDDQKKFSKEHKKTIEQVKVLAEVLSNFSIVDYVFDHTHYDNCDNGRYWRMS